MADAGSGRGKDGGRDGGKADGKTDGKGKDGSKLAGKGIDGRGRDSGKADGKDHEGGKFADKGRDGRKFAGKGRDGGRTDGKGHEGGNFADKGRDGGKTDGKGHEGGKFADKGNADGKGREGGKFADGARGVRPTVVRSAAAQAKSVAAASRIANRFAQINVGALAAVNAGGLMAANASAAGAAVTRINAKTNPVPLMKRGLPPDSSAVVGVQKENPLVPPVCDGRPCSKFDSNAAMAVQVQAQASGTQSAPSDSLSESFHEIPWKGNSGIHKVARSRASVTYTETLEEVNFMGTLTLFVIP